MESFKIENVSFTYPLRENKTLDNINITINAGEFVLICGKSGCGKTTLLRLLKPALAPFGKPKGTIYFQGTPLSDCDVKEQAANIGFVMQSCDNQIVTDKVWHELAFGLESLGIGASQIRTKVAEMASFFGLQEWFHKKTTELSGGQKQLLNLASVMVMQPSVLILDEPTSQLDPIAAQSFLKTLEKINRELGTTVILTEHRLEDAFPIADRVIVLDAGKVIADAKPQEVGKILKNTDHDMFSALPAPMRIYNEVPNSLECPLTVRDGRCWLEKYSEEFGVNSDLIPDLKPPKKSNDTVIEIKDVWFRYQKDLPDVIEGLNLKVNKGELLALVGGNGTGKTTLLSLISGLNVPYRGKVLVNGKSISKTYNPCGDILGVLPQNPQSLFVKKTVFLDLMEMLSEREMPEEQKILRVKNISLLCRIENLLESHPYDLSGGEQQRAALAKVLLLDPEILLLDEPTKGMDAHFKEEFSYILSDLKSNGVTIIMVSHDIEFCAEYASRCALVFDGGITSIGTPREFFAGNSFYTTSANRMARTTLANAVLAEDIIKACGGKVYKKERQTPFVNIKKSKPKEETHKEKTKELSVKSEPENQSLKFTKTTLWAALILLFSVPFTIYIGSRFFGDRKYYFTSLLIIFETIATFCMTFERRKPKARELVVVSALCAISVAGRAAFFTLPQFKPVAALVIISGVCFGGETGFLVGAVTAFVSNLFFGHGPWTPWQMFALGLIGFVSGILFEKGSLRKMKATLCIFGFLATFVIYGGIMNPASVIMVQSKITPQMILISYLMGLSFDLVHALSTAFFLWFISEPMICKLERIKLKYGLIKKD